WRAGIIFVIRNATDGAWAAHCEASDRGVSAKGRRSAHEINKIAGERRSRGRNGAGLHKRITRSTFRASRVFLDELEVRGIHDVEGESTAREGGCAAAIRRSVRGIELIGSGRKDGSAGRTVVKIIGINYAAGDAPTICGDISDDGDIGHSCAARAQVDAGEIKDVVSGDRGEEEIVDVLKVEAAAAGKIAIGFHQQALAAGLQ